MVAIVISLMAGMAMGCFISFSRSQDDMPASLPIYKVLRKRFPMVRESVLRDIVKEIIREIAKSND